MPPKSPPMDILKISNPSKNCYSVVGNLIIVSLFVLVVFFLASSTQRDSRFSSSSSFFAPKLEMAGMRDELDAALEKAASNKTLIIAVVNKAYAESEGGDPVNMLDLFLESFWLGEGTRPLISNLLIVATDRTAYERCVFRGLHCYLLADGQTDGSDSGRENVYLSKGFLKMMSTRTLFLLTVLRKGYNFIFTDTDVMWLRNPFTIINTTNISSEIQFSTDEFRRNPRLEKNRLNTGFYFVRSTERTVALFERWCGARDNATSELNDQVVLKRLVLSGVLEELNVTASFLETRYFSGFCQDSKELDKVVTVHANCCRYIRAKIKDLAIVLDEWKQLKRLPANRSSTFSWSSHDNCYYSWPGRIRVPKVPVPAPAPVGGGGKNDITVKG